MSDTDLRTDKRSSQGLGDKLQQAGEDVKQRATEALDATSNLAREQLDELGAAARETAGHAADKVREQVDVQQKAGADYARRFAENIRSAAKAFEQDTPIAASTIKMAADYVEDAADKMRNGSMNDLIDGVTSFARRQPAAFLGLSVLAGFAVVRFLKASGSTASTGAQAYGSSRHDEFPSGGARRSS